MARFSEAQKQTRRQEILDAALRCFSRDGFHNTTTADIVRESGVSQGTLYLYFATKDDLIVALADDRHQGEILINALVEGEPDPVEGLSLLFELHGRSLTDPRRVDGRRVGIQGWSEALRNPVIHNSVTTGTASVRREIERLIERGQLAGQFRADADPEAVARILDAAFQGLTLQVAWGEEIGLDQVGRLLREMVHGALFTDTAKAARIEHVR
jgi:AcrR family transcriptional regulator